MATGLKTLMWLSINNNSTFLMSLVSTEPKSYRPIYTISKCCLVSGRLLLRDFEFDGIIFMIVYVIVNVTTVILLRDFGPNRMIFMSMGVYYFRFSHHS
jgi:hypothetical protein